MNIAGVLVSSKPENMNSIQDVLTDMDGVEIHVMTEDGKMVVTVEDSDDVSPSDTLMEIQQVSGVISTAMVYQYCDDICATKKEA